MFRVAKKPAAGQTAERSSPPGGRRTSSQRNIEGRGKEEDARALPAVPAPAAGGEPAMRWALKATQDPGSVEGGSGNKEPFGEHPMDEFDNLLRAFDGILAADGTSTALYNVGSTLRDVPVSVAGPCRHIRATSDSCGDRLPRLEDRSSSTSAADDFQCKHPLRTCAKRRRMSHSPHAQKSPHARWDSTLQVKRHPVLYNPQDDDPLNLVLRSKGRRRPGHAFESGTDDLDTCSRGAGGHLGDGGCGAIAGVFRLQHVGTGFVHYGYSWDIAGAEMDQLRRLSSCNISPPHPHRGLSAVVRKQRQHDGCDGQIEPWAPRKATLESLRMRFEVVRQVPMPTRFRASDFEKKLREACGQELLERREHLLVLAARQYQNKHVGPAFRRMLAVCGREGDDEQCAAAAEVQRAWRGFQVRYSSRRAQERELRDQAERCRARVGAVLAIWAQAKHRGKKGRQRANEKRRRQSVETAAREKQAAVAAAFTIQKWLRSVYQARREAAAAADKAANDDLLSAIRAEDKANEPLSGNEAPRPPPRPISASEARVANDLCQVDTEASLSGASDWSSASLASTRDSNQSKEQQPQRAPSAHGLRHGSTPCSQDDNNRHQSSRKQRGSRRPASAPRFSDVAGEQTPGDNPRPTIPAAATLDVLPDASRLVLEGDPGFAAATAIQAAWRGFVTRMALRKRRRAAAALRRKREGKWRQQRGVVGKQVSVAWDERRGMEEGGGRGDEGRARRRGSEGCIDIQVPCCALTALVRLSLLTLLSSTTHLPLRLYTFYLLALAKNCWS